ncbi:MAG: AIPR family protein [Parerythrobacter sp.]
MASLLDWSNVEAATKKVADNLSLEARSEAFSLLSLGSILKIDFDEARGALTDGSMDRGVDAIFLDERFGSRLIHIFQFKCHATFAGSKKNFPSSEIDKLLSFITDLLRQTHGFIKTCNPLLKDKVTAVWDFIESGSTEIRIHICSNGENLVQSERERFEQALRPFKFITVAEHDLDNISNKLASRSERDREICLRMLEEQIFEKTDGNVRAVIGTARADEFIEALKDPRDVMQLDPFLFEENVRMYLGEQNDVNKKIYDTAISEESSFFWYFNNGITVVCESFSYQPGFSNPPITLRAPQIVNGSQTSHALFEASKVDFGALKRVRLLIKIIETKDKSLYAKIAEATNSQTPIRSRDLRSNDPILLRLESALIANGWYLDRKRDQHSEILAEKRIDALKLGQIWLAFIRGEPDRAKTASDRIFGEYFPLIFDPSEMSAERVISVWKFYLALEGRRRSIIQQARTMKGMERSFEAFWMIEGVFHLSFAVKRIAERKGYDLFDSTKMIPLIDIAADRIEKFVKQRPGISYYRLFRTAATKHGLFESLWDMEQAELPFG